MKKLTDQELLYILGGKADEKSCDEIVADANQNGDTWSDEEWDKWADKFAAYCK